MTSAARHRKPSDQDFSLSLGAMRGDPGLFLTIPVIALSFDGFRAWAVSKNFPQNIRAAFIDKEVILEMSNEELETHALVKGEISRVLMTLCREINAGQFYPDGVLVSNSRALVSNNPDASFVSWESIDAGRVERVPRRSVEGQFIELVGSPDWVLEVVSDASVEKDTVQLRKAYHKAGIREYWLVDARGEEIAFSILYRRKKNFVAATAKAGWQKSIVFDRSFRLVRELLRPGFWRYTLEMKTN